MTDAQQGNVSIGLFLMLVAVALWMYESRRRDENC